MGKGKGGDTGTGKRRTKRRLVGHVGLIAAMAALRARTNKGSAA
jgi:hypothetical protein